MMRSNRFEIKVEGGLENLPTIGDFITRVMTQMGAEEGDIFKVQLAVDEACTNIIQHAYSGKGGIIAISCELQDSDFVITLRDGGRPFDPNSVPPPDLQADLDERKVGGLGIYWMRKLMDDVSYNSDPEKGNELTMRKRLNRG